MIIIVFLFSAITFGQTPEKMSYQAVLRDANNTLIVNQQVGMQISILQGENPLYVETHMPTTNSNGLVSLEIGNGSIVSGVFSQVDWSEGTYFIKTETDLSGGSSYTIIGTSQLLSVPYALHAKTAGGIDGSIYLSSDSTVQLKGVISNRINALSSSDGSISWSGTEGNLYELITIKDIIPNADGIIDIDIRGRGSSNAYGFLNVLQITEKGPN
tara:strand:+ start:374 stop:1015 length:642 start_codon:yes stop_codon:yes gene_type:complete